MQTGETIWYNGKFVPWHDAKIHVLTHTLHYGGGALEGIRFYQTAHGSAIFRLQEHVDRLFYSASVLKMRLPFTKDEITDAIKKVAANSGYQEGYIRPIAFYGQGKLSINPVGNPVEVVIAAWPWESSAPAQIDVKISSYCRIHPSSTVIDAKLCAHYLNGILATLELQGTHYHEALYLDANENIAEGIGANFFMVKSGVIYTPKRGSILVGITRDTVITLARRAGFDVLEADISVDEVFQADEAFLSGTAAEITPIRSVNDRVLGEGKSGAVTPVLKDAYLDLVHGRDEIYSSYLTRITD